MNRMKWILLPVLAAVPVFGAQEVEFFEKKIRPILVEKCYSCHSAEADKIKGGLVLDTREGVLRGGDSGPSVVPGDTEASLLLTAIRYSDRDIEMPPKEKLSAEVVADFERWILDGAADPRDGSGPAALSEIDIEEGRKHWSFQPITNPPVPEVKGKDWPRTDIDRFVLAALEEKGLAPVVDADPLTLARRAAFDLTGLPPDGSETSDLASQIERLLASPQFGERWGRHWLDVARYGESTGGAQNVPIPLAFKYRDYVIESFRKDKPYDRFLIEQIAGDLLPAENDEQWNEQLVATGYLVVGIKDMRERDTHRFQMAIADEQIDALGRGLLGLTIACAKCHDHKFDPIPTRDYYSLAGIFASTEPLIGAMRNRLPHPFAANVLSLAGSPTPFSDEDMSAMLKVSVDLTYASLKVRDEKRRVLMEAGKLKEREREQEAFLETVPVIQEVSARREKLNEQFEEYIRRYNLALPYAANAVRDTPAPKDVAIHIRGEDSLLGEIAPRGFPEVLSNAATPRPNPEQSGRLELAYWIASPDHPLTARVMVNRIWHHLFGVGLVETPDDFGTTGQAPSNPALLDHLATRFLDHGWSVKGMIAEIMSSRVYHLSSVHDEQAYEIDPDNRLHWRMSRRRLDSNAIRDTLLHVSGQLVPGTPSPHIPQWVRDMRLKSLRAQDWFADFENYRTLYLPVPREYVPVDWSLFDFPEPELVTGRRSITTVPTQALYFMNSPFVVDQARFTAERLLRETASDEELVESAYRHLLHRPPTSTENEAAQEFLKSFASTTSSKGETAAALVQTLLASSEFRHLY